MKAGPVYRVVSVIWRIYAGITLIVVGAAIAFAAWSAFQLYYYHKYGTYDVEIGQISAYAPQYSYRVGEPVELYIHSTADAVGRLVRFGATRQDPGVELVVPRTIQSTRYSRRQGVDWRPTATLPTQGLEPGLYGFVLRQTRNPDASFLVPLILKPTAPPPIAVIASTNTWEAYNAFGGASNYENLHINSALRWIYARAVKPFSIQLPDEILPRSRPNSAISQDLMDEQGPLAPYRSRLARPEWSMIAFLEREGYDYGVYSSQDFAFSDEPSQAKLLIFAGHSEYWTPEMFHRFERYERSGGNVFISAGNPMFRSTEFRPGGLRISKRDNDREMVSRRIGAYFTGSGMRTAAPYRVDMPSHWVFAGTGLSHGDEFGAYSANSPPNPLPTGRPAGQIGASGVFTNKIGMGSGDFLQLATGLNEVGPAHMVYRDTGYGGWIFNTSSGSFTGALGHDAIADQIVRNVVETALAD